MSLLIDGHNLIGRLKGVALDDPDDEARLVELLRAYRARTGARITVVFDPGSLYLQPQTWTQGGLQAVFASPGTPADALLVRRIRRCRNPRALTVVSSDRAVAQAAQAAGARVIPAELFAAELESRPADAGSAAAGKATPDDVRLSPAEVKTWLALFEGREG